MKNAVVAASLALACVAAVAPVAGRAGGGDVERDLDRRVQIFSKQLRCLVCQNETLADSQADLAVDLRREIRELMAAGRSDEEITAFLTDRYGDFVLYRPPLRPSTYLLWFGPFILLGGGGLALYRELAGRSPLPGTPPLSAGERQRVRRLLEAKQGEEIA